jgi:two-component system KDP operon response regulator KdpE
MEFKGKLILVVDDEKKLVDFIRMNLELEGFRVSEAYTGMEALEKVRKELPDLVLLDVMLPDLDGFEVLEYLREFSQVPVIMLTVRKDEEDKIRGLELGADDYITKPFSPRELVSRIKAVLRRVLAIVPASEVVKVDDDLTIDFRNREVIVRGQKIKLRPTEHRLLYHLVNNAGWVMPHDMLLSKVWGREYRDDVNLLRLYINYLRQKIEPDPSNPRYILTEKGVGYKFVDFRRGKEGAQGSP